MSHKKCDHLHRHQILSSSFPSSHCCDREPEAHSKSLPPFQIRPIRSHSYRVAKKHHEKMCCILLQPRRVKQVDLI